MVEQLDGIKQKYEEAMKGKASLEQENSELKAIVEEEKSKSIYLEKCLNSIKE